MDKKVDIFKFNVTMVNIQEFKDEILNIQTSYFYAYYFYGTKKQVAGLSA